MNFFKDLDHAIRIVVNVTPHSITYKNGSINLSKIEKIAKILSNMESCGKKIIIVSSGAIGIGINKLNLNENLKSIKIQHTAAAVGQCELISMYSKFFEEYNYTIGQVLLTGDVLKNTHARINICNTFDILIKNKIIPIVSENYPFTIDEINNIVNLTTIVSKLFRADISVNFLDIEYFYSKYKLQGSSKQYDII
ncbi:MULTISPECIES: hypothetical protein [Clostridium]|uniref:amino acid kinase family protein n=1 Tax=Clostridium TaxID=1485 RepID=UPI0008266ED4|nr:MULTISPECIES: hypothetical protein [Clostridium]PJI06527.1 glutamate 5-kinase [Clostridium sp. CT7]